MGGGTSSTSSLDALLLWRGFCSFCSVTLRAVLRAWLLSVHLILPAIWQGVHHSHFTDEQREAQPDEGLVQGHLLEALEMDVNLHPPRLSSNAFLVLDAGC